MRAWMAAGVGLGLALAAEGRPPNVLVVLSDDQGWGDLSVNGNTNLSTPRIDSLARDGATFDRFFVCPVCSPTRAEFLTGRYHLRGGVRGVSTGGERLNLDERTIADAFKAAGYATGAFGKWHNGSQYPYHPNGRGFDEYYGFTSGHWGSYFSPPLDSNGVPVRGNGFLADDLTDHAMQFIERNRGNPFFCYVPYNTPHSPMQVPDRFFAKFDGKDIAMRGTEPDKEDPAHTRAALAMCENLDWNVGRMLDRLDALKLSTNTIVLYFCDNGPNGWRWNGGMKGRKGSTDEGGVRSPLLIRWPGRIPAGLRVPQIAGAIDLLPTLSDLSGVPVTASKPLDGTSLAPHLLGVSTGRADRTIFSHWGGRVSVRTQRFRLDATGQLFDMVTDPGQTRDVAAANKDEAARLSAAVAAWKEEMGVGRMADDRPFPVGHPGCVLTQLPARDGVPHGGVRRSAKAPNCSYFTHWTSTEDSITWDVDVATAGRYAVDILYACPAVDVGSAIEVSLGASRLAFTVDAPNDPPLTGSEHDRVSRDSESYVKDFRPMNAGVIDLPVGRGPLTLRAMRIPGSQAMEVRALHLTRLP